jgi:hypothetical protein
MGMAGLTGEQVREYLQRCYQAVDGLWFIKLEERHGFDAALDVDVAVWEVMPKIQARKLKELTGRTAGLEALQECLGLKLELDGFRYRTEPLNQGEGFQVVMDRCPWQELLVKANREHLAGQIGNRICRTEYGVWAREFGPGIRFELADPLCAGGAVCRLCFRPST